MKWINSDIKPLSYSKDNKSRVVFKFDNCTHWLAFEDHMPATSFRHWINRMGSYYSAKTVQFEYAYNIKEPIINVLDRRGSGDLEIYIFRTESVDPKSSVKKYNYFYETDLFPQKRDMSQTRFKRCRSKRGYN